MTNRTKNTINRINLEMTRLANLSKRGYFTKEQAMREFKQYLEQINGKRI